MIMVYLVLVASILGFLIFNQTMNLSNIVGISLILGVVIYVQITESRVEIKANAEIVKV